MLETVEIGVVESKRVGARDVERAVGRKDDAPLDAALGDDLEVLEAPVVVAQARARDPLAP